LKILEDEFGVSATPQVATVAAPAGEVPAGTEEKSSYNVVLTAVGDRKI